MSCDIEDTCVCRQDSACFDPTCSTCPTCVGVLTGLDDAEDDDEMSIVVAHDEMVDAMSDEQLRVHQTDCACAEYLPKRAGPRT